MGSEEIWELEYRQPFCFIGVHGKEKCFEKIAEDKRKPA